MSRSSACSISNKSFQQRFPVALPHSSSSLSGQIWLIVLLHPRNLGSERSHLQMLKVTLIPRIFLSPCPLNAAPLAISARSCIGLRHISQSRKAAQGIENRVTHIKWMVLWRRARPLDLRPDLEMENRRGPTATAAPSQCDMQSPTPLDLSRPARA
ncbi:hypothetical protein EJ04DRAFT_516057 [Polyplosphaeria fusca]|uniref:Uncharacterized protein n=1 Tax=Polyplosphaeria fusca TaxID=682080 RepID=A0A9P4QPT7_9PLEO|nr:hypothetical protein EJ04DRAFT_516057 [Polyplosphaeria fusca]